MSQPQKNIPAYLQNKKPGPAPAAPTAAPVAAPVAAKPPPPAAQPATQPAAKPMPPAAQSAAKPMTPAAQPAAQQAKPPPPKAPPAAAAPVKPATPGGGKGSTVTRDDLTPCRSCGRRFLPDRVQVHEQICTTTGQRKRKPFDPKQQRLAGTPAEAYNRGGKASAKSKASQPGSAKKPDWRRKHNDFISTIRAAKQMKVHLAAGGKVSDLPPPPRSDYSDYINCPHCGRNFNQTAAERHIPQCANFQHNKVAPKASQGGSSKKH